MKQLLIAIVACGVLLAACGGPEGKFIGKYDGEIEIPQQMIDLMKSFAEMGGEDADAVIADMQNAKISMELKKDGVCTMTAVAGGETHTNDATWSLNEEGNEITIKIADGEDSIASSNMMPDSNTDLVFAVSNGGKVLTFEQEQMGMKFKMTFTRR